MARKIVTNILNIFIEENISRNSGSLESAKVFLEQKLDSAIIKLEQVNKETADFQRKYSEELIDFNALTSRKRSIQTRLCNLHAEYNLLSAQKGDLNKQILEIPKILVTTEGLGDSYESCT
jgi:uncharacterized protein (DUF3084 family)